jgi:predicted tellurium resistance membrane protein TerC
MQVTDWLIPLVTLTAMEIVLGIDNIIFIAILVGRLPEQQRDKARQIGLGLALAMRLLLLFTLQFILGLTQPLFSLSEWGIPRLFIPESATDEVSWRDIILFVGGLFLIGKSTYEIHDKLEGAEEKAVGASHSRFGWTLLQIALLDIIFSLDSVITAVGMAQQIAVMVAAMIIAVGVMLLSAGAISRFVHRHPTIKILALSFLILIGVMLVAESFNKHIEKGYIYFAMAFSLAVEMVNMRLRPKAAPVELHEPQPPAVEGA